MPRIASLSHLFVDQIPDTLQEGVLYVVMDIGTVVHRCCCGCGNKVVTPLSPTDWTLLYNGDAISLHPSIGNWAFPCRSHYWIRNNAVVWTSRWTEKQIDGGRARDRTTKELHYRQVVPVAPLHGNSPSASRDAKHDAPPSRPRDDSRAKRPR